MSYKDLVDLAKKHGWTFDTSRKHFRLIPPEGSPHSPVWLAATPSEYRSRLNLAADLRKRGVPVPHRGGKLPKNR